MHCTKSLRSIKLIAKSTAIKGPRVGKFGRRAAKAVGLTAEDLRLVWETRFFQPPPSR
jgi:hypothetical protein